MGTSTLPCSSYSKIIFNESFRTFTKTGNLITVPMTSLTYFMEPSLLINDHHISNFTDEV